MDDVRAVLDGSKRWCVVRGDAVVWMLRLAWEFGPFAHATFCDPPYHLTSVSRGGSPRDNDEATPFGRTRLGSKGFMGTTWDGGDVAHRVETWRAALLCSLPGAHLLAASGTRTYHRLAVAAEDAGWDVREMLGWLCAQGMAKTGDVSKRIDKMHGATREVVSERATGWSGTLGGQSALHGLSAPDVRRITAPATDDARQWEGWSESLAPSMEPMLLARKPFRGSTAANLLTHGCGALNIDAGRVGTEGGTAKGSFPNEDSQGVYGNGLNGSCDIIDIGKGRWPKTIALVHNEECRRVGTKKVKGFKTPVGYDSETTVACCGEFSKRSTVDHTGENGEEVVEAWECEPSCAIKATLGDAARFFFQTRQEPESEGFFDRCRLLCESQVTTMTACQTPSKQGPAQSADASSSTENRAPGSAQSGAPHSQQHEHGDSVPKRNSRARRAASDGRTTRATSEGSVRESARPSLSSKSDPDASDAASHAVSCATDSAQSHASHDRKTTDPLRHGLPSTASPNAQTQTRSRASCVRPPESTATTRTTPNLSPSCGCASRTTAVITAVSTATASTAPFASVPIAPWSYQGKAHASERWMLVTCGCGRRAMRRTAAKHLTERRDKTTFCTLCKQPAHVAQHATVKPLDLDRWLARLVCVPGGVTLVPFCGSGSEMITALEAGSRVIGFELEQDHADIAVARLTAWDQGDRDDHDDPAAAVENLKPEGPRQRSLFGGTR